MVERIHVQGGIASTGCTCCGEQQQSLQIRPFQSFPHTDDKELGAQPVPQALEQIGTGSLVFLDAFSDADQELILRRMEEVGATSEDGNNRWMVVSHGSVMNNETGRAL